MYHRVNISEKSGVIIEIKDNGNGITQDDLKSLFHRYYRATNTGERHKGSFWNGYKQRNY
ncbi:ATP-binding protein [Clostridium tagluense]|nr:ATP-binding protein [Clostridium tagluense]MCB2319843.1 ATP-binding protein [Clostridium tagluense]MCB2329588.1 ATP-binding protein [Clostridium tagluense]MCB2363236.1 ATP-binding protein [Clostridium tagluense]